MEWYFRGSDEVSDRFPSPESWQNWGVSEPESFNFSNKGFDIDAEGLNFNGGMFSNEVEMESCNNDNKDQSSSSIGGGFSEESLHHQAPLSCDQLAYQLDGLARFEQMDELFLSSLIEDLPGNVNDHESFCFELEFRNDMERGDDILTETSLTTQSISSDTHTMGSSMYLKTHAFSPLVEKRGGSSPQTVPRNSQQKHCNLVTALPADVLVPSENYRTNEQSDEETSLEESVLQEMETVMAQLTEKTRICFRDALYRLAKNSRQHVVTKNQDGNFPMGTPSWTGQDEKISTGGKKPVESETNTIDRAIANLMFNKMEMNMQGFPVSASVSTTSGRENLKARRPCNSSSLNEVEMHGYLNLPGDAEVPILCQSYRQPTTPFLT